MPIFGISGALASLIIQILALIASFALGALGYRRHPLSVALVIGLSANIVGQIIFAGGGPGACVGMVIIPLYCLAAGYIGKGCRWAVVGRHEIPLLCHACGKKIDREHPGSSCPECGELSRCARCGYSLQGNVTGRCPECGHQCKAKGAAL